jgi:hypothetical protein
VLPIIATAGHLLGVLLQCLTLQNSKLIKQTAVNLKINMGHHISTCHDGGTSKADRGLPSQAAHTVLDGSSCLVQLQA